jgi:hypothetical protein
MEKENASKEYFFYNGIPYKKKDYCNDDDIEIHGNSVWDDTWSDKIKRSDVRFCEKDEIEKIYIENCKEAIKLSLLGWTSEMAKELETKGRKYLTDKCERSILKCPDKVYNACKEGKYGIIYKLSDIELSDDLKIGNKPCSDGIRRNEKEYMRFLMREDFSIIQLFAKKWPMLKFKYAGGDEPFPDLYCMVPFYNDHEILLEIHESVLI